MKTTLIAFFTAVMLSGCVIHVVGGSNNNPTQHSTKRFELDAVALNQLQASTGAGSLLIQGEAGRTSVEVVAEIYTYDGVNPDISLEVRGDKALLQGSLPKSLVNGNSPYINLTVKVPTNFGLVLDDGSGDTVIEGLTGALQYQATDDLRLSLDLLDAKLDSTMDEFQYSALLRGNVSSKTKIYAENLLVDANNTVVAATLSGVRIPSTLADALEDLWEARVRASVKVGRAG